MSCASRRPGNEKETSHPLGGGFFFIPRTARRTAHSIRFQSNSAVTCSRCESLAMSANVPPARVYPAMVVDMFIDRHG